MKVSGKYSGAASAKLAGARALWLGGVKSLRGAGGPDRAVFYTCYCCEKRVFISASSVVFDVTACYGGRFSSLLRWLRRNYINL